MAGETILRTASFADKGGWALDTQFIAQMGDAFLLAHGLGRPVADAIHELELPAGRHCVWAYTRDWVSPHGPGRFQVVVNGQAGETLGHGGDGSWGWVFAGEFDLPGGKTEIRLRDLTGFDGRVAAIFFSQNLCGSACSASLREKKCAAATLEFDLVVAGGGYAGMCAAVAAARAGVKVALVQDRPVFGGNASSEVRVGPIGGLGLPPYPRNSDLAYELHELTFPGRKEPSGGLRIAPDDAKIAAWLAAEPNLTLFPLCRVTGCEVKGGAASAAHQELRIESVRVFRIESGETFTLRAKHFADCTGDAILAEAAGVEIRSAPEPGETIEGGYGSTNFWTTRWTPAPDAFPPCPWALRIDETNWRIPEPRFPVEGDFPYAAGWNWESGFDRDPVADGEAVRDLNLRAAYGMWDFLKNRSPDRARYERAEMDYLSFVLGKRAARRIVGDHVLTERDLREHVVYPDGVVTATWYLDLHKPHPENERHFGRDAFRSIAYDDPAVGSAVEIAPYPIPFRCLYSKDVANLWMAGKDISATHVAMASVRVENTTAMMGTVVGRAVALALGLGTTPRGLASRHFGELAALLENPGPETNLAKRGRLRWHNRLGLKNKLKNLLRPLWRLVLQRD